jgi:hypothetical protein
MVEGNFEAAKFGRNEPMMVATHKCVEATLGISLYSYLYLKLAKPVCLSYYLSCFLFNIIERKREEEVLPGSQRVGELAQTVYTHVSAKTIKKKRREKKQVCIFCLGHTVFWIVHSGENQLPVHIV